jgi:hypothetical protein
MKYTESQYINAGFVLARAKGWRFDRAYDRIELMISQEDEQDKTEARRLVEIGKAEGRH